MITRVPQPTLLAKLSALVIQETITKCQSSRLSHLSCSPDRDDSSNTKLLLTTTTSSSVIAFKLVATDAPWLHPDKRALKSFFL
jgi:hypothetical protein